MEKVPIFGPMEATTQERGTRIKSMVTENISGAMEENTRESGG